MPISSKTAQGANNLYVKPRSEKDKSVPGGQSSITENINRNNSSASGKVKISSGDSILDTYKLNAVETSLAHMGMSSVRPELICSLKFEPPVGGDLEIGEELYSTGAGELIDMQCQLKQIKYTEAERFLVHAYNETTGEDYKIVPAADSGYSGNIGRQFDLLSLDSTEALRRFPGAVAFDDGNRVLDFLDSSLSIFNFVDSLNIKTVSYMRQIQGSNAASFDSGNKSTRRLKKSYERYDSSKVGNKIPSRIGLRSYMVDYLGYSQSWWEITSPTSLAASLISDTIARTVYPMPNLNETGTGWTENIVSGPGGGHSPGRILGADDLGQSEKVSTILKLKNLNPGALYSPGCFADAYDANTATYLEGSDETRDVESSQYFTFGDFQKIWDMIDEGDPSPLYMVAKDYMAQCAFRRLQGAFNFGGMHPADPITNVAEGTNVYGNTWYKGLMNAYFGRRVWRETEELGDVIYSDGLESQVSIGDSTFAPFLRSIHFRQLGEPYNGKHVASLNQGGGDTPEGTGKPAPGREYYLSDFFETTEEKIGEITSQSDKLYALQDQLSKIASLMTVPDKWKYVKMSSNTNVLPTGMVEGFFDDGDQPGCPASFFTDCIMHELSEFLKERFTDHPLVQTGITGEQWHAGLGPQYFAGNSGWNALQRSSAGLAMTVAAGGGGAVDTGFDMMKLLIAKDFYYAGEATHLTNSTINGADENIATFAANSVGNPDYIGQTSDATSTTLSWQPNFAEHMQAAASSTAAKFTAFVSTFQNDFGFRGASSLSKIRFYGDGYAEDGHASTSLGTSAAGERDLLVAGYYAGLTGAPSISRLDSTSWSSDIDTFYAHGAFGGDDTMVAGIFGPVTFWVDGGKGSHYDQDTGLGYLGRADYRVEHAMSEALGIAPCIGNSGGNHGGWRGLNVGGSVTRAARIKGMVYNRLSFEADAHYGAHTGSVWDIVRRAVNRFEREMGRAFEYIGGTGWGDSNNRVDWQVNKTAGYQHDRRKDLPLGPFEFNRSARLCVGFILLCSLLKKTQRMALVTTGNAPGDRDGVAFVWSGRAMKSFTDAWSMRHMDENSRTAALAMSHFQAYDTTSWQDLDVSQKYGFKDQIETNLDIIYGLTVPQLEWDVNCLNSAYFVNEFVESVRSSAEVVVSEFANSFESEKAILGLRSDETNSSSLNLPGATSTEILTKMLTKDQVRLGRSLADSLLRPNRWFPIYPRTEVINTNQAKCLAVFSKLGTLRKKNNTGAKRMITVGLPHGLLQSLRNAASASGADEYRNSNIVKISLWRRNLISEEIVETPQTFVFDTSKFIIQGACNADIELRTSGILDAPSEFEEGMSFRDLVTKTVFRTYGTSGLRYGIKGHAYDKIMRREWRRQNQDTSTTSPETGGMSNNSDSESLVDMTGGGIEYIWEMLGGDPTYNSIEVGEFTHGTAESILDLVAINHIVDHYLKMYAQLTLGINLSETAFPLSLSSDIASLDRYNNFPETPLFQSIDKLLSLSYPTRDTASSLCYSRIRQEVKRSSLINPEVYRNRVIYPKAFDRIFSFAIDDTLWPGNDGDMTDDSLDAYGNPMYEQYSPTAASSTSAQGEPRYYQYFATVSLVPDIPELHKMGYPDYAM